MQSKQKRSNTLPIPLILIVMMMFTLFPLKAEIFILNTISQTISKYDIDLEQMNNAFVQTGLYPNKMAVTENFIYLTNSGDNNVQKININNGSTEKLIPVEDFSNPYDIIAFEGYLYVTGLFTNKVYKINRSSDEVVAEVEVGIAPGGMIIVNNKLYVANSGFSYPDYFEGSVSVISLDNFSVVTTIPTPTNPQRMALDSFNRIHLVCTGDYGDITGRVVVIDTAGNSITETIVFDTYLYNITICSNGIAYVGDAFGAGVLGYNTDTLEIIYDMENIFAEGGGAFLEYYNYLIIADAKDFQSNSTIGFYGLDEQFQFSVQAAIGAIDLGAKPRPVFIDDTVVIPQIAVYPNPFSEYLMVETQDNQLLSLSENDINFKVGIYNIKGQLIREIISGRNSIQWDGRDKHNNLSPSGIYLINVLTNRGDTVTSKKVMLIR